MQHLAQFFVMQAMAAEEGSDWPRLRAVLQKKEYPTHILNKTEFKLTIYAAGVPTWQKKAEIEGRPEPRGVANDLMGDVLREAGLLGFDAAARARHSLNYCHPNERPPVLPEGKVDGEILPH